ncbi:MAG TPA: DUF4129 domain-containing protein, partial [Polyangiaceae bacterium]
ALRFGRTKYVAWLLLFLVPAIWVYRARSLRNRKASPSNEKLASRINEIVRQYRVLERHLEQLGVGRPQSTPPLAHAQMLAKLGHPVAKELLDLTQQYLEIRFGGAPFDDAAAAEYARNIQRLRRNADARPSTRAVA